MTDSQPLTAEELAAIRERDSHMSNGLSGQAQRDRRCLLRALDALRAELDAANAAGEKLACDLATVSGALDIVNAELAALKARPVKVKPLIFRYHRGYGCLMSQTTDIGQYLVGRDTRFGSGFIISALEAGRCDELGSRHTEEDAISFAQADYERRILSSLDLGEAQTRPAQEDHSHAARLNRLLEILRRLKWRQSKEKTLLSPAGPADALNELGLFMIQNALDEAIAKKERSQS